MKHIKKITLLSSLSFLASFSTRALEPLPQSPPIPANNLMTPAKIELGKQLYFDRRLSKSGAISCNSCHNVMSGGDDGRAASVGHEGKLGARSSPTVWNAAFLSVQFWDGRAASLEEQAKGPLVNPVEMAMDNHDLVVKRVAAIPGYQTQFKSVFGTAAEKSDSNKATAKVEHKITIDEIAQAIATYERTLITPKSPFDRFLKGDKKALNASAQRGMQLIQTVGCIACHSGALFAGPALPPGVGFYQKFPLFAGSEYETRYELTKDLGRFNVTQKPEDKNFWRVPTWRNIALTAPYFHNGKVQTLDEAVRVMAKTQLNKTLPQTEVTDIVEFLNSLTGEFPKQTFPRLPELRNQTFSQLDSKL